MNNRLDEIMEYINKKPTPICAICGEVRGLHRAHIIPKAIIKNDDIIYLCPSHHQYYDNGQLTNEEFESIKPKVLDCIHKHNAGLRKYIYRVLNRKGRLVTKHSGILKILFDMGIDKSLDESIK